MTAALFTTLFVAALAVATCARLYLSRRHVVHVRAHRDRVPRPFADRVSLAAHQKAADYTVERTRFAMLETIVDALVLLALTLGGALALLVRMTGIAFDAPLAQDLAMIAALALVSGAIALPFGYWHTFRIEAKYGFNRTTLRLWLVDLVKGTLVAVVLGLPLAALVLWLMRSAGTLWWLYAWAAWIAFQVLLLALYPTLIAPLFNKFTALPEGDARTRIEALLARCGFANRGLFVMDGSRRSSHGNAYFTGFGRAKRIVFFDTLIERLAPDEIEAVLAHELGHFKLKHVAKRMVLMAVLSLGFLALLAWLAASPWFYQGLGVPPSPGRPGVALVLFFITLPVFTFVLQPLSSMYSRKHEFEADAFATRNASASAMTAALVKLYEDNASTLTPDPVHSAFYDSHPPAAIRIGRLARSGPAAAASVP